MFVCVFKLLPSLWLLLLMLGVVGIVFVSFFVVVVDGDDGGGGGFCLFVCLMFLCFFVCLFQIIRSEASERETAANGTIALQNSVTASVIQTLGRTLASSITTENT